MTHVTDAQMEEWIAAVSKLRADYYAKHYSHSACDPISYQRLKRWIKVTAGSTVFAFIDPTNGDVLMPASYARPAKHARGNLNDASKGLSQIGPHGPAYLR